MSLQGEDGKKLYPACLARFVMKDGTVRPFLIIGMIATGASGVIFFDGPDDVANFPDNVDHESQGVKSTCIAYVTLALYSQPSTDELSLEPGSWHWPYPERIELQRVPFPILDRIGVGPAQVGGPAEASGPIMEEIDRKLENFLKEVLVPRLESTVNTCANITNSALRSARDILSSVGEPQGRAVQGENRITEAPLSEAAIAEMPDPVDQRGATERSPDPVKE